jgi:hypothetical protein
MPNEHVRIAGYIVPRIDSEEKARKAVRQGVIAAGLVAIYAFVTFVLAGEAENLVDCLLFIVVCWRLRRMSRIWALIGLLVCLIEVTFVVTKFPSIFTAALFLVALAAYVSQKILLALTPETTPIVPDSSDALDLHVFASHALPMPLNHEFHHYLFYRKAVASSGFILEGEATANGEYMAQMIREGAFANPNNKKDLLEQMTLQLFKLASASTSQGSSSFSPAGFDWALYNKLGLAREQSAPLTGVQCQLLGVLHEAYSGGKSSLPLAAQLSLDPKRFQAQSDLELAYAEAWAVYHVDNVQHRGWHETMERLVSTIQKVGAGALTDSDREQLAQISKTTLDWVDQAFPRYQSGCTALQRVGNVSSNVD